ncbi:MAG TPA: hypothetical protein VHR66_08040 [Gemmataceae bacterium]|jgi:hypothetical protein|nr:hypothetical protein [Gemmataceae bacterium]
MMFPAAALFGVLLAFGYVIGMPTVTTIGFAIAGAVICFAAGAGLMLAGSDAELDSRRADLTDQLPAAKEAWLNYQDELRAEREARRAERERATEERRERDRERREQIARDERAADVESHGVVPRWMDGGGRFNLEIVGESHYQRELERVCGGRTRKSQDLEIAAVLLLDDGNPHDAQAVRVEIKGLTVGYLSRENARIFRARLRRERIHGSEFPCRANVRGGWDRGGGDSGSFGVWLDVCLHGKRA